ncbi:MAG: radical SAM protein [Candidatus Competibacteraceae bacterium]|nr:radical SAM protein [Candidatus Competibacteraceae bacterium]
MGKIKSDSPTPVFPRLVHIENTNACPARCVMCPMDVMQRPTGLMRFDLFERLVRECAAHPEVRELHLHGFGEPLLDKSIGDKVAFAKNLGIPRTYIVTTGSLLKQKMARSLIKAGLDGIKFSFYGMSKQTYESIHQRLDFETTVRNIEGFFEIRDQLKAANPAVRFQFNRELAPPDEFDRFIEHWRPYMDRDRGDEFFVTGLHNWAGGKEFNALKRPEHQRHCAWPFRDIQILWDGRVVPCVFDYDAVQVIGDVNQTSIAQVWHSQPYEDLRQIWRERRSFSNPLCAACDDPDGTYQPDTVDKQLQPLRRRVIRRRGLRGLIDQVIGTA